MRFTFRILIHTPAETFDFSDLSKKFRVRSRLSKSGRFWGEFVDIPAVKVGRFDAIRNPDGDPKAIGKLTKVLTLIQAKNAPLIRWEYQRLVVVGFQTVSTGPINTVKTRGKGSHNIVTLIGTDFIGEMNKRIIAHEVGIGLDAADMVRQLLTNYMPEYADLQSDRVPPGSTSWPGIVTATGFVDDWEFSATTVGDAIARIALITGHDFWQGADVTDVPGGGLINPGGLDFFFQDYAKFIGSRAGGPNEVNMGEITDPQTTAPLERTKTVSEQKRDRGVNTALGVGAVETLPRIDKFEGNGVQHEFALSYEPKVTTPDGDPLPVTLETVVEEGNPLAGTIFTEAVTTKTIRPILLTAPDTRFRAYNIGVVDNLGVIGGRFASLNIAALGSDYWMSQGVFANVDIGGLESINAELVFIRMFDDVMDFHAKTGETPGSPVATGTPEMSIEPCRVIHRKAVEWEADPVEAIAATRALTIDEETYLSFSADVSGVDQNVQLTPFFSRAGKIHVIRNAGTTRNIIVTDGGAARIVKLEPGEQAAFQAVNTTSTWRRLDLNDVWDEISPAQIVANRNDYGDTGEAVMCRINSDAVREITGIVPNRRRLKLFVNIGSFMIRFTNLDAASAAANRLDTSTGGDVALTANGSLLLAYDPRDGKWRDVSVR